MFCIWFGDSECLLCLSLTSFFGVEGGVGHSPLSETPSLWCRKISWLLCCVEHAQCVPCVFTMGCLH